MLIYKFVLVRTFCSFYQGFRYKLIVLLVVIIIFLNQKCVYFTRYMQCFLIKRLFCYMCSKLSFHSYEQVTSFCDVGPLPAQLVARMIFDCELRLS